jgi:ABC-2 type transport system ATP-binding protein
VITFDALSKRYRDTTAVDELTVCVAPGHVTALLGPNGAGKSTSLRLLLGLDRPTSGQALVDGRPYASLRDPLRVVGAHLDGRAVHPAMSARGHLLSLARANRLPSRRVDEVIEAVGLRPVARRPAGKFSLGMAQRLGIAGALLGDPEILVLDEPVNGLDTDGVRWIRQLLRDLAAEGRTVLMSSHLMAEVHQTADHVLVLGRGRLLADCPTSELVALATDTVALTTPDVERRTPFAQTLRSFGMDVVEAIDGELRIRGGTRERIGDLAYAHGVRIHGLAEESASLEDGYLRLVASVTEFAASDMPSCGRAVSVQEA